jgi:hypothetical protein
VILFSVITSDSCVIVVLIIKICRYFGGEMQKMGKNLGMEIGPPLPPHTMREPGRDTRELEEFFRSMKDRKVGLVFVVVPDRGNCYGKMLSMLIKSVSGGGGGGGEKKKFFKMLKK